MSVQERPLVSTVLILANHAVKRTRSPLWIEPALFRSQLQRVGESRLDATPNIDALPRLDAHYLRQLQLLRRVLAWSPGNYLHARATAARALRALWKDYLIDRSSTR